MVETSRSPEARGYNKQSALQQFHQVARGPQTFQLPAGGEDAIGLLLAVDRLDQRAEFVLDLRVRHWIAGVPARELDFADELLAVTQRDDDAVRNAGGIALVDLGIAMDFDLGDQID